MDSLQNEDKTKIVCSFFRHCDGYPSGHGDDLAAWLKDKNLVNGMGADFMRGRDFNRAGSMAVHLMHHIDDVSGCEVTPTGNNAPDAEYIYSIRFEDDTFYLQCDGYGDESINVSVKEFNGDVLEKLWNEEG